MFATKYKPTTQKSLFHKDIVNHIRKWIKMVEEFADNNKSTKHILFLYGPIGCSKTVTVECLFKGYNLFEIDADIIRSADKISEVYDGLVNFRERTLANIEKWNYKNNKEKSNIIIVDNLELCEKGIEGFIENIHIKRNINIPIIMICNSIKYKDLFINHPNCTFLEFKKPSLLELSKLSCEINKSEKLDLTKDQIRKIVEKSEYDIRQLLFLLEQWHLTTNACFDIFLENIEIKNIDRDLLEKMEYLCNYSKNFDFTNHFVISSSEPLTLSNSIYQNYINLPLDIKLTKQQNIEYLDNITNIMDNISVSNIIHNEIYENQNWDLYNSYIAQSSVIPSYYVKKNNKILFDTYLSTKRKLDKDTETAIDTEIATTEIATTEIATDIDIQEIRDFNDEIYKYVCFKDISYNFINSYMDVKRISNVNLYSKMLHSKNIYKSQIISDPISCFYIIQIYIKCIDNLNTYFNKNKKGKNTTKKEKLELCNNIGDNNDVKYSLDTLVDSIYEYRLFEIDIDDFLMNKSKYKNDDNIKSNIQKVDLRIFKRLLNIFTIDDKHKNFKSHIETSIQYKILQKLVQDNDNESKKISLDIENVLTQDLNTIWNI
jgi:DNA polymerase III delta prime subunit